MPDDLTALHALADALGVATEYVDGLGRSVHASPETLLAICAALGAPLARISDAEDALRAVHAARAATPVPPVLVAWDGRLPSLEMLPDASARLEVSLESGETIEMDAASAVLHALPIGRHTLRVEVGGIRSDVAVLSAPERCWRPSDERPAWGLALHLAALRTGRSRSVGDLEDLRALGEWMALEGAGVVALLPLLPTFNTRPSEPSPYAPVSRLFWSELVLDLGERHEPVAGSDPLDLERADKEVRRALAYRALPQVDPSGPSNTRLGRYARFRGAQARLGRDWRRWHVRARGGTLTDDDVDPDEARFHRVAQLEADGQIRGLIERFGARGLRLGLDLAVGVHPDGFDPWDRPSLFAPRVSVGAPPDRAFPSGQDWGFAPVLPDASRAEGHAYFRDSVAHQAAAADLLRIDHVMAMQRLFWIPHGADVHQGTYVRYPMDELFAVLSMESHLNRCEMIGENLGTVSADVASALDRHRIRGLYLVQFAAENDPVVGPSAEEVAMIGSHDTAPLAGWVRGADIDARVDFGLLPEERSQEERERRAEAAYALATALDLEEAGDRMDVDDGRPPKPDPARLVEGLLTWLGESPSPLVLPWIEDLWLEDRLVNVPGTPSDRRPNWLRPMAKSLEDMARDPTVLARVRRLRDAR